MIMFDQERQHDAVEIEKLLDAAFGPKRFEKSSYVLRQNLDAIQFLSLVARRQNRLIGSIRYFPVHVCDMITGANENALLLGPLAVSPDAQQSGVGGNLVAKTLASARAMGHKRVLLVGDAEYYGRFGFEPVLPRYITLPDGRDARRLLVWQSATMASLPAVGKLLPGWSSEAALASRWMPPEFASAVA